MSISKEIDKASESVNRRSSELLKGNIDLE